MKARAYHEAEWIDTVTAQLGTNQWKAGSTWMRPAPQRKKVRNIFAPIAALSVIAVVVLLII